MTPKQIVEQVLAQIAQESKHKMGWWQRRKFLIETSRFLNDMAERFPDLDEFKKQVDKHGLFLVAINNRAKELGIKPGQTFGELLSRRDWADVRNQVQTSQPETETRH